MRFLKPLICHFKNPFYIFFWIRGYKNSSENIIGLKFLNRETFQKQMLTIFAYSESKHRPYFVALVFRERMVEQVGKKSLSVKHRKPWYIRRLRRPWGRFLKRLIPKWDIREGSLPYYRYTPIWKYVSLSGNQAEI